jgi:hypothetical protein
MLAAILPPIKGSVSTAWDAENVSVLFNFGRLITKEVVDRKKTKEENILEVVSSIEQIHFQTKLC